MSILVMSKKFSKQPSEILGIENSYDAFCFDEACVYIMYKLESGCEIKYQEEAKEEKHYQKLSDMYKDFGFITK